MQELSIAKFDPLKKDITDLVENVKATVKNQRLNNMLIKVPLFVRPAKKIDGKKYYLNLNNYRNWHFQVSNKLKKKFSENLKDELSGIKFDKPIEITFTLWKGSKRKIDRSNILSIVEKFFCDALVNHKCIPDDNDDYLKSTHYYTGGIDRENPRVEINIS